MRKSLDFSIARDEIIYTADNQVQSVRQYININGNPKAGIITYRQRGEHYFRDTFDEHHAIYKTDEEVSLDSLPAKVRRIFGAITREEVQALIKQRKLMAVTEAN